MDQCPHETMLQAYTVFPLEGEACSSRSTLVSVLCADARCHNAPQNPPKHQTRPFCHHSKSRCIASEYGCPCSSRRRSEAGVAQERLGRRAAAAKVLEHRQRIHAAS